MRKVVYASFYITACLFCSDKLLAQATNKIDTVGNVGIGTTSPAFKLDIAGETRLGGNLYFGSSGNPTRNQISQGFSRLTAPNDLNTLDVTVSNTQVYIASNFYGGGSSIPISINTYPHSNQLYLETNGNVGIGTINPSVAKLQIAATPTSPLLSTGFAQFYVVDPHTNGGIKFAINDASDIQGFGAPYRHGISAGGSESLAFLTNNGVRMVIDVNGKMGIGTTNPSEKLSVNGNISTKKVIVTQLGWSDYVFNKEYKLRSLTSLETYIKQNKHLPDIPTTKEVEKNGISVGDNQALLLKKIEELTLYLIQQQKVIDQQNERIKKIEKRSR